jgi:hypothetical protein
MIMKTLALLWAAYTVCISGPLVAIGWLAGFILVPFSAGFDKGGEHHSKLLTALRPHLK